MHSNNETGVLQPIAESAELAHSAGAILHTDAAQSAGKVVLNVRELGVDLVSVAGHKLYAPKGVGALYVRRGTPMVPFVLGAGHERGLRPGTENVAASPETPSWKAPRKLLLRLARPATPRENARLPSFSQWASHPKTRSARFGSRSVVARLLPTLR
jgi:hypothetical protein